MSTWVVASSRSAFGFQVGANAAGRETLVATNKGNRWFFVFGFEKNERANISDEELEALQDLAADLLARTSPQLDAAVADGTLQEICHDDQA